MPPQDGIPGGPMPPGFFPVSKRQILKGIGTFNKTKIHVF